MKVLVVGSGGREHTLVWKISQSRKVKEIHAAPGNAGICKGATCVSISPTDIEGLVQYAASNNIDLTVVGPEAPLAEGIVDRFEREGLRIFGPTKKAAEIESSKIFAKNLMKKYGIPTAEFEVFKDPEKAIDYVKEMGGPIVVKADGLAAGKGAIPCKNEWEAIRAIKKIMVDKAFGDAGKRIVVEEFMEGEEASILAFTDGENILPLEPSQDHKRAYDGDRGPNTGGMGAYSPAPVVDKVLQGTIFDEILAPAVRAMKEEGREYRGILYAGLMITKDGPKVVEFNCRFGDPETQAVLPRLMTDIIRPIEATIDGDLDKVKLRWRRSAAVCVVMASEGYPGKYQKGFPITGIEEAEAMGDLYVFHAGTKIDEKGDLVTAGGRVLGVTALGRDIPDAIKRAYEGVSKIHFEGAFYRRDIGYRALEHLGLKYPPVG
ncbi:MAG: phosphoribosylamine--glycine ligase [Thermoplasmata archaeon]|nr:phosphoribosylamine--glycine ligase [Thermoplasmata archaeon]